MNPACVQAILDFWFLPSDDPGHNRYRPAWWRPDAAFDATLRARFGADVEAALAALAGAPSPTPAAAEAALAAILVLDPLPRNLFRGTARAFAGDARARQLATDLVAAGRDKNLPPIRRWFVFMPFMHSESLIDQERAVALFAGLRREAQEPAFEHAYEYALDHRDVIERFGRFPQRNAALGRVSTVAETEFLGRLRAH